LNACPLGLPEARSRRILFATAFAAPRSCCTHTDCEKSASEAFPPKNRAMLLRSIAKRPGRAGKKKKKKKSLNHSETIDPRTVKRFYLFIYFH
jgi:hypothetical protein